MSSDYSEDHNDFIVELQSLYIACAIDLSCFFFFNQQFITQSVMADCGSYNITTLNRTKTKENKRKQKKRKRKKSKSKNEKYSYNNIVYSYFFFGESIWVIF